ncbi:hypothetical protein LJK88_25515 [Paenibacillus sp. P26]|nr:hypothetical protein LJK88_25515 [Paenibacillus sp. P26]UUZ95223.1 hypothetical protein LJK87_12455 [Paenibacillus sp. P25]
MVFVLVGSAAANAESETGGASLSEPTAILQGTALTVAYGEKVLTLRRNADE